MKRDKELVSIASDIFSITEKIHSSDLDHMYASAEFYDSILPDYMDFILCGGSRVVGSCVYDKLFEEKPDHLIEFGNEVVVKFPVYSEREKSNGLFQNSHEIKIWNKSTEKQKECLIPLIYNNSTKFLVFPKVENVIEHSNHFKDKSSVREYFLSKNIKMQDGLESNICKNNDKYKIIDYGYNVTLI